MSPGDRLPKLGTHIPALDGIRGIAILLVMVGHFTFYGGMDPTVLVDRLYFDIATVGGIGVDLFFVLSGFLITGILYDTRDSGLYLRSFYSRRVLRIFPLYYGFLVAFFIVLPRLVDLAPDFDALHGSQVWYWTYLVNVDVSLNGWPEFGHIGHFWSLAVEEQFYLVWPLVVLAARRRTLLRICVACIVAAVALRIALPLFARPVAASVLMPARMDGLAVGAFIALVGRGPAGMAALGRWVRPVLAVCGSGLIAIWVWRGGFSMAEPVARTVGLALLALFFGALLTAAIRAPSSSVVGKLFAHPGLRFLGRYSYALYVFHHPVIFFMKRRGYTVDLVPELLGSQLPGQLALFAVAGGISTLLALLSWYLWEHPFLKLKRLVPYR
jgi:peptidoglycan/LPS O-acetylase OafA/YrhL